MRNHAVSYECLSPNDYTAKEWSDRMNKRPKEVDYKVKNKSVRAGVERRPRRRAALKAFFDAKANLIEHLELGHHSSDEVGRQAPGEHAGQRVLPRGRRQRDTATPKGEEAGAEHVPEQKKQRTLRQRMLRPQASAPL